MLVVVEELRKSYGRKGVLAGIDLVVERGEVVALAGRNGAGKTTLLHTLMGLLLADHGRVAILGEEPSKRCHLDRTGWMPERPQFPRQWRVERLIRFQLATFPCWNETLCRELIERLRVDLAASAGSMSRGERAKVALLLALSSEPELLLLDDPTLGLDPGTRRLLLGELLAEAAERGTGVLCSTHLLAEFDAALDRLLILENGRIELAGTVEDLRRCYRRLHLPEGATQPPPELSARPAGNSLLTTRWSDASWHAYRASHPTARVESLDIEEIFVALTGGAA